MFRYSTLLASIHDTAQTQRPDPLWTEIRTRDLNTQCHKPDVRLPAATVTLICINHIYYVRNILIIFNHMFLKQYKFCLLYTNDINNGAYCRLWSHANSGLSLAVGFKPAILHSVKMARLYRNMSQLRV
jgi:hypothetical protein